MDRKQDGSKNLLSEVTILIENNKILELRELLEEYHLKSIRGGNDTYTITKQTEFLELADGLSKKKFTRGGQDNKYRKLRGIGEYSKQANERKVRRSEPKISNNVRLANEGQDRADSGEYP